MTNGTIPPPPPPGGPAQKKGLHPLAWVAIGCGCLIVLGVGMFLAGTGFVFFKAKEAVEDFQENPAATTARLIALANPDIELVETDEEAGTVTFRNTRENKEFTVDYEDIKDGRLTIQTEEGDISFDAQQTDDGGTLTIQGPDGETQVNLGGSGEGDGGTLEVTTPDGTTRFGAGQSLEQVPDWVPLYPQASETQNTYSTSGSQGDSGILAMKTPEKPEEVMEYYKGKLEDEGYEVTHQTMQFGGAETGSYGTVTGKSEGREVNVMVGMESGQTTLVLQYNGKNP